MENTDGYKNFIRDNFQPIFLGNTRDARKLAKKLFKQYRIVSYIFDTKRPLFSDFALTYTFFRVSGASHEALLVDELNYIISLDSSCVFAVAPFTKEYAAFIESHKDTLEQLCVLRTKNDIISKIPFINN